MKSDHVYFMGLALEEARRAAAAGEIPVGAVLVKDGRVLAVGRNTREETQNALGHAELSVIAEGCRILGSWRLDGCTLYVTLEPCPMCAGAAINARLDAVIYGASSELSGSLGTRVNLFEMGLGHRPRIKKGILEPECTALLQEFFRSIRQE